MTSLHEKQDLNNPEVKLMSEVEDLQSLWTKTKDDLQPDCKVCSSKAPYTCPKCKIPYCSLDCYKEHSKGTCATKFYKKEIMDFSGQQKKDPKKIKELLSKYRNWEDIGEDVDEIKELLTGESAFLDEERCQNLLEKIEKGEDIKLSDLTVQESKIFGRFVEEQAHKYIQEWTPFWLDKKGLQSLSFSIVTDTTNLKPPNGGFDLTTKRLQLVERMSDLPKYPVFRNLSPQKEYGLLCNIIACVGGVAFVLRYHNCNLKDSFREINCLALELCEPLSQGFQRYYSSSVEAGNSVGERLLKFMGVKGGKMVEGLFKDLSQILSHEMFIAELLLCLYDSFDLEEEKEQEEETGVYDIAGSDTESTDVSSSKGRSKWFLQKQKIQFFSSFLVNCTSSHMLERMKNEIDQFIEDKEKYEQQTELSDKLIKESEGRFGSDSIKLPHHSINLQLIPKKILDIDIIELIKEQVFQADCKSGQNYPEIQLKSEF